MLLWEEIEDALEWREWGGYVNFLLSGSLKFDIANCDIKEWKYMLISPVIKGAIFLSS
jgi:hypothetical protein